MREHPLPSQKLKVDELEKYLRHFNLSLRGKKNDKVRRVIAPVCSKSGETLDSFANPQNQLSSVLKYYYKQ